MRESNSRQRFWRPLSYHLTNPLYSFVCLIVEHSLFIPYTSHICQQNFSIFFIFLNFIYKMKQYRDTTNGFISVLFHHNVLYFFVIYAFAVTPMFIFLNTTSRTFPIARTRIAAAIASGIPDAVTVPITSPHTALTATSFASAYCFANII